MLNQHHWLGLQIVGSLAGLVLAASTPLAAEDPEMMANFLPFVKPYTLSANAGVDEQAPVEIHGGGRFSLQSERAGGSVQPWIGHDSFGNQDEMILSARGATTQLDSTRPLPQSGPIPDHLTSLGGSLTFRQVRPSGVVWGVSLGTGSSSDKPFGAERDLSLNLSAFVDLPAARPHDAWLIFAGFSSDRSELNYLPLPGFAYLYQAPPTFRALLGLPFDLVSWKPQPDLRFDAMAMVFGSAHVGAAWFPLGAPAENPLAAQKGPLPRLHLDYDWGGEAWKLHDRPELRDQLFIRSERITGGIALDHPHASFDIYGGYAFHREIFQATSVFGNHTDRIDLKDGVIIGATVRGKF